MSHKNVIFVPLLYVFCLLLFVLLTLLRGWSHSYRSKSNKSNINFKLFFILWNITTLLHSSSGLMVDILGNIHRFEFYTSMTTHAQFFAMTFNLIVTLVMRNTRQVVGAICGAWDAYYFSRTPGFTFKKRLFCLKKFILPYMQVLDLWYWMPIIMRYFKMPDSVAGAVWHFVLSCPCLYIFVFGFYVVLVSSYRSFYVAQSNHIIKQFQVHRTECSSH